jgi:ABC-2 type transport system permease protein
MDLRHVEATVRKRLPVFRRAIADSWRSLLGWTIGVTGVLFMYLPLFPSFGGAQMAEMIASLPPELVKTLNFDQIATGAGYTQGTFFGLIGFLLLTIAATSWGSAAIAGAEESGSLELTLAHGVGRVQYALESALAVLVRLLWLGTFATVLVIVLNEPSDLGIEPAHVVATSAALVGLTMLSAAFALAVGALTGRGSFATSAGAGVAVLGYVFNAIANQSEDAEPLRAISPYAWAYHNTPLLNGADWGGLGLLWGLAAVLVALSALALRRRDITG